MSHCRTRPARKPLPTHLAFPTPPSCPMARQRGHGVAALGAADPSHPDTAGAVSLVLAGTFIRPGSLPAGRGGPMDRRPENETNPMGPWEEMGARQEVPDRAKMRAWASPSGSMARAAGPVVRARPANPRELERKAGTKSVAFTIVKIERVLVFGNSHAESVNQAPAVRAAG